jgi:hypothetical protein
VGSVNKKLVRLATTVPPWAVASTHSVPIRAGRSSAKGAALRLPKPTARSKPSFDVGQMALGKRDPKAKLGEERLRNFGLFEKNAGYTQPYRETYIHLRCGKIHRLEVSFAEFLATAPTHFRYVRCDYCRECPNINEFVWNDGKGTKMGSRQNYE